MKSILLKCMLVIIFGSCFGLYAKNNFWPKEMVISVPVANVCYKQREVEKSAYVQFNWNLTSQVLLGEKVTVFEQKGDWLRVNTFGQKIYVNGHWYECSGWIKKNQAVVIEKYFKNNIIVKVSVANIYSRLSETKKKPFLSVSLGTMLCGKPYCNGWWVVKLPNKRVGFISTSSFNRLYREKKLSRKKLSYQIVKTAKTFVGLPYLFGGRSFYNQNFKNQLTSIDCSSLIQLCYKVNGINIPRNTASQYEASRKIEKEPNLGDLIFFATHNTTEKIKHVLLYMGNNFLLESLGGKLRTTRIVNARERLGCSIDQLKSGDSFKSRSPNERGFIYFGSYL